jgi:excisionase family DNA binding protein
MADRTKRQPDPERGNLVTIPAPEAARRLKASPEAVRFWIRTGDLPAKVFPGGRIRIRVVDVEAFAARQGR